MINWCPEGDADSDADAIAIDVYGCQLVSQLPAANHYVGQSTGVIVRSLTKSKV